MTGKISSNTETTNSYAEKIKGKAAALASSKSVSVSAETNLAVNHQCESCYNQKNSVLSGYSAQAAKDATQLIKIAKSFEIVDKQAAKTAKTK